MKSASTGTLSLPFGPLAAELDHLIAEMERLDDELDDWRAAVASRCERIAERLQELQQQLNEARANAVPHVEALKLSLSDYLRELREGAPHDRLRSFQRECQQRYATLLVELEQRRVVATDPAELSAPRVPKLGRALFHVAMGLGCVVLYQFLLTRAQGLFILGGVISFFGAVEIARRYSKRLNDFWVDTIFRGIARPQERYRINSASYYLWGLGLIVFFAPREIACAAMLVLALGDPLASAIGFRLGGYRFANGKSLLGALAFLVASSVAVAGYLLLSGAYGVRLALALTAAMSITGMLVELFVERIDDNLSIPVSAAVAGMLVLWPLGLLELPL